MFDRSVTFEGGKFRVRLRDDADESVLAEVFKWREYRAAEATIRQARQPIIDIGAHAGFFTIYCRALNPLVPIVALEPEAENRALLEYHCRENKLSGVTVVAAALAGESGERTLALSSDSFAHRLTVAGEPPAERATSVEALSFADLCGRCNLTHVALIKFDIEGGEYEALLSLTPQDASKIDAVILEYHEAPGRSASALAARLRESGFGVQRFPSRFEKHLGFLWATR